ncbi:MAG: hypothetical protein KIH01_08345, partial [Candidatus Freyarchaeota archaeon]|nr:hypothetical protein [Candidatus Jordarchaeia archaeon]
ERIRGREGGVKLVADISTGHNIYIASMLEALRAIIVYDKLGNGVTGGKVDAAYAVSEPVASGGVQSRRIFINEYDVKAFFALPIKPQNLDTLTKLEYYVECDGDNKKRISRETEDTRRKLKDLLDNLAVAFNSIRYNVPLAFYHTGLIRLDLKAVEVEEELVAFLKKLEEIKPVSESKQNEYVVTVTNLKWKDLFNLFYSIALFKWISNEMGGLGGNKLASVTELKKKFTQIYNMLGLSLNSRFLERDLNEIENKKNEIQDGEWTPLKDLFRGEGGEKGPPRTSDPKRNFFAHSGLERTVVEVKKCGEEICLRYNEQKLGEIRSWLLEPEG